MKLLITGGCGFLGSNLASHAIQLGIEVIIFDNLSRTGSYDNLKWLQSIGKFTYVHGDIRNNNDVVRLIQKYQPNDVFHLAGQVAMTTSINNPKMDFDVNIGGTFNLLEAIRLFNPSCSVIYSSSNKVYGDLEQFTYRETDTRYECIEMPNGFDESVQLTFHSPYGCSKGAADQYMLDYARIYELKTAVFRHSSMYGGRQFATVDQGWVGWFCQKAIEANRGIKAPFTISGNGKQVRDVLHAEDIISLYFSTLLNIELVRGNAFNIGGTIRHSLSLLELFSLLEDYSDTKLTYAQLPVRESDQKVFVADVTKINNYISWSPKVSAVEGIRKMYEWCNSF
ncbi:CDP-paratose 2-epimerase [Yersinia enterocolitica]|nr:CDP-paratose 2-epimerase [Yersinia enterocolitica]HDL8434773.1 GDP-mannose 4,6-dehydratase [Yersinia enterocolitica]HDL8471942.1 GDP-mannose 4,6-dehydratase [Yersinia enterocolitica]HDL8512887.1 GDP-mannose 4,6-dehydratase [Yersinia enterocolitica]